MDERHSRFLKLFTSAQPMLRRFVLAHLPDFHEAEDALQRAALVLWEKFDEFRPGGDFAAWAFGVARNEVLYSRRGAARSRLVLTEDLSELVGANLRASAPAADRRRAFLAQCLAKLPDRSRRAVALRYEQGRTTGAVAAELGATVNAARLLLFKARAALARCLDRAVRGDVGEEQA